MSLGGVVRVDALTLVVDRGEVVALRGESGSGKTTILRLAAGLVVPQAGTVRRLGRTAVAFQDPRLLPWRSTLENVLFALGAPPDRVERDRGIELLERLGLADVHDAPPATLSGGMRARVALARALVVRPDVLVADEPFAHLDPARADVVAELLLERARAGAAVLFSGHGTGVVDRTADRVRTVERPARPVDRAREHPRGAAGPVVPARRWTRHLESWSSRGRGGGTG